jgi:hypothetical protein
MAKAAPAKATFSSVLDMPSSEVERIAKPLPVGSYLAVVQGQPKIDKSSKKQTEYSEYTMKILEALDDVDEDALGEYLTAMDGSKKRLTDCTIRNTYYHTENSIGRLATFFDHLDGITPDKAGDVDASLRQRMGETAGKQCVIHIKHEPFQSGEGVRAVVASTSIAE